LALFIIVVTLQRKISLNGPKKFLRALRIHLCNNLQPIAVHRDLDLVSWANWNALTRRELAQMDQVFLAVMVSSILVLIAAAGLFVTLPRDATTAQAPVLSTIGQGRH
jgi:hypothetical protein